MLLDIFHNDAFSVLSLTDAILKVPYKPSRIGDLGLFRSRGVTTTTAMIEEKDGRLSLIQSSPRGGPASTIGAQKRRARAFVISHLERESTVLADEIQNVRAFGSQTEVDTVAALVGERLTDLRAMHEVTQEHLRAGAIQGIILDANGDTIYNLFTEFGVGQQTATVSPNPSTDEGDALRAEVVAIQRQIESELGAEPISGYHAFCGAEFFDTLRADLGVTQSLRWADPQSLLQQNANARMFQFAGVTWEEYRTSSAVGSFFATDEAYVFPEGTGYFVTYFAPADFIETVNTIGLPVYAKLAYDDELNRWVKIHTQSNPLSLCLRPRIVVKTTLTT